MFSLMQNSCVVGCGRTIRFGCEEGNGSLPLYVRCVSELYMWGMIVAPGIRLCVWDGESCGSFTLLFHQPNHGRYIISFFPTSFRIMVCVFFTSPMMLMGKWSSLMCCCVFRPFFLMCGNPMTREIISTGMGHACVGVEKKYTWLIIKIYWTCEIAFMRA